MEKLDLVTSTHYMGLNDLKMMIAIFYYILFETLLAP